MIERIKKATQKLIFCSRIIRNPALFIKLTWHTKKYKWSKSNLDNKAMNEPPAKYTIRFNDKKIAIYLRTFSGDIDIFYEVFLSEVYKLPTINAPKTIVDLGANTGLATLYFASKFPEARIVSVEPLPGNVAVCKKNFNQPLCSNVSIMEAAINDINGPLFLSNPPLKYNSKVAEPDNANDTLIKVRGITMADLLKECGIDKIDIMKIDIEGAEVKLFTGDISWLNKVTELVMEVHSALAHEITSKVLVNKGFKVQQRSSQPLSNIVYWLHD